MIKVIDEPSLVRQDNTGIIHNTDQDQYREYIAKRNAKLKMESRLNALEADNAEVKSMLTSILSLLQERK
jgi:hypothetical protein